MKIILFFLNGIVNYGWLFLLSLVWPVYWSQDSTFKNKGWDIIHLFNNKTAYIKATYWKKNV